MGHVVYRRFACLICLTISLLAIARSSISLNHKHLRRSVIKSRVGNRRFSARRPCFDCGNLYHGRPSLLRVKATTSFRSLQGGGVSSSYITGLYRDFGEEEGVRKLRDDARVLHDEVSMSMALLDKASLIPSESVIKRISELYSRVEQLIPLQVPATMMGMNDRTKGVVTWKTLLAKVQEIERALRHFSVFVDACQREKEVSAPEIQFTDDMKVKVSNKVILNIPLNSKSRVYQEFTDGQSLVLGVQDLNLAGNGVGAQVRVPLGKLRVDRWISIARQKLWWMSPTVSGNSKNKPKIIPKESQFVLGKVEGDENMYVVLVPLVDHTFRSSLYGKNKKNKIELSLESGDSEIKLQQVPNSLYISAGSDPYELIDRSFDFLSTFLGTFKTLRTKEAPPSADRFGWCTWDAFYSKVNKDGVRKGLQELRNNGTPAKFLILDDGWQSTGLDSEKEQAKTIVDNDAPVEDLRENVGAADLEGGGVVAPSDFSDGNLATRLIQRFYDNFVQPGELNSAPVRFWRWFSGRIIRNQLVEYFDSATDWSKRLQSVEANEKFDPLNEFVGDLKKSEGVEFVYCWHALLGYWLGIDTKSEEMKKFSPEQRFPCIQPFSGGTRYDANILKVEPSLAWTPVCFSGFGLVSREKAFDFYSQLHAYLKNSNVDGVKVDAQSVLSVLGMGDGGGGSLTRHYVRSMEESVHENLNDNVIACMAHASDNLFSFMRTPLVRASDDFYPKDDRSHTQHVTSCAFNSLFLGQFALPDWDCFHSSHSFSLLHATARAIAGGPLYVSDRPGNSDFEILRKLVLPDGTIYRANFPGRPTEDCMFNDTQADGYSMLKVWNRNNVNGIVGAFNVQGWEWNRKLHDFSNNYRKKTVPAVSGSVRPIDVHGLHSETGAYIMHSHATQTGSYVQSQDGLDVKLDPNEVDTITVAPVFKTGDVQFASIGCPQYINGAGAVLDLKTTESKALLKVRGNGKVVSYTSRPPHRILATLGRNVQSIDFKFSKDPSLFNTNDGGKLEFVLEHKEESVPTVDIEIQWE